MATIYDITYVDRDCLTKLVEAAAREAEALGRLSRHGDEFIADRADVLWSAVIQARAALNLSGLLKEAADLLDGVHNWDGDWELRRSRTVKSIDMITGETHS